MKKWTFDQIKRLTLSSWSITEARRDRYKRLASSATHFRPNTRASGLSQYMMALSMGSSILLKGKAWETCQTARHWLRVRFEKVGAGVIKAASDPWWSCCIFWARSSETVGGSFAPASIARWRRKHPAPDFPGALLPSRWVLRLVRELKLIRTTMLHMRHV